MDQYRIVVADSSEHARKQICQLLNQRGYQTIQATDGAHTIRICRRIYPDLVIVDDRLFGMNAYEVGRIIEEDGLSTVIFMTNNPNYTFYENLKKMNVFAYITTPIQVDRMYEILEFSIMNANRIKKLSEKIQKLENTLESRKLIDRAKGLLMEVFHISEKEAYNQLRKQSMDECVSMEKISQKIIQKYQ